MKPTYITNETGAVTVDWVVLTGALVGLGLAVMGVVSSGIQDTSGDIKDALESDENFPMYDIVAIWSTDSDGGFTFESFGGTGTGDFDAIGGLQGNGRMSFQLSDGTSNNGTHTFNLDMPLASAAITMNSLRSMTSVGNFQVLLEDGTLVNATMQNALPGEDALGINQGDNPTIWGDPVVADQGGEIWFNGGLHADQSAVSMVFDSNNVAGLSANNGIVEITYDQASTEGADTVYNVLMNGQPL